MRNMSPRGSLFYAKFPLPASGHQIRVLAVKPGLKGTPIHASVKIIDLDDQERDLYDTLSYTWDNQSKTRSTFIEGNKVLVTPNLFNALQYLRSSQDSLFIWADAVCINQDDNVEKSSQVAMMDKIYRNCGIVHMWLGCAEQPMSMRHSPFALVEHFRDDKHFFELPGYRWDEGAACWECDTDNLYFRSMMEAFLLIYRSTWWERAWTAQESILPKVAIFRYGHWTMPLDDFWTCQLNRIRHLGSPCCVVAYQATGAAPGPRETIDHVLTAVDCVKSLQDPNGPYQNLLDVYRRFANRQCCNPRDKIYSLLGFLGPNTPILVPDYSRPIGSIYIEVFCNMIRERQGNLSSLLGEGFNSGNFDLPSWVPDFSGHYGEPGYFLTRALRAYPFFNACGDRSGRIEIVDDKCLRVTGFCIGRVTAKSRFIHAARAPNQREIIHDWRETCLREGIIVDTETRDKAFSLLLSGEMTEDLLTTNYRLLQEDDPDFPTDAQWQTYMGSEGDRNGLPRAYRITVGCMVDRKVLFTTSGGQMGLSWPVLEIGDEVWILDGGNTPFLLRKPPNSNCHEHRNLVGDVYLYGVMHGEALQEARTSESVILV